MREVWISIRVGLTPRCDAMIASRWRLMDQERPKFRRAQFLGQLRCLPLCWGFPLSGVALFFRHLRTGHRSCATAIGLPKREVSVPQPRAVYPRFFFLPSVVGSQRQWQDAIKAITYSTTRTVRVGEALRCSGNTMAGFGDRVLKVVQLTAKQLGRSPQARKRMKARNVLRHRLPHSIALNKASAAFRGGARLLSARKM